MNTSGKKKKSEWEIFKDKFGRGAYVLFPLFHIVVLLVICVIVYILFF